MANANRVSRFLDTLWQRFLWLIQRARSFAKKLNLPERARQARRVLAQFLSVRRSRNWSVAIVVVILISALAGVGFYLRRRPKTTYYIAYVGRYQRPGFDELHTRILTKYIDLLNAEMQTARFELKIFNTKVDVDDNDSVREYEKFAKNPQYAVVIDNTWGSELKSVAPLIQGDAIPVIAINADKQGQNYNHQAVFIGHDDEVPMKVINFDQQILKNGRTIVIAENSFASRETFSTQLPGATYRSVKTTKVVPEEKSWLFGELNRILSENQPPGKRVTLVVHTHGKWGDEIIKHIIESNFRGIDILGGPFITNRKLSEICLKNKKEDNRVILWTEPSDAVTDAVRSDILEVKKSAPQYAALNVELFAKRSLSAISVVRAGASHGISRESFISFFKEKLRNKELVQNHQLYSFDDNLLLADERRFEQCYKGAVSSYPQQLNSRGVAIPNIHVGLDDVKISAIDTRSRSFHAKFLYWLKWNDPKIDARKYIFFRNQKEGKEEILAPSKSESETGEYRLFKMSGDFEIDMDLTRYPLDQQEARIELAVIDPHDKVRVSFDHDSFRRSKDGAQTLSVDEWNMSDSYVTIENVLTTSLGGGNPQDKELQKFEIVTVRTPVKRLRQGPFVVLILPLFMIGLAAIALLYVKDKSFSNRGEVCVVILLTIVTYSIGLASIIPRSNSMTVADKLFFGTFLTVFLVFLKLVVLDSGVGPERVQVWLNNHVTHITFGALLLYAAMSILTLTGWDVGFYGV